MTWCGICRVKLEDSSTETWEKHRTTPEHQKKVKDIVEDKEKYIAMKQALVFRPDVHLFNED